MKRLDQLTFTRFLALLLVIIYHGAGGIYIKPIDKFPISSLLAAAPTAVSYLYVLSGFVMSLVYYRPKERFDVRGYWMTRIVRIYPLYIISFLLVCLFYFDFMARIKAPKILVNIFVLQAWYPPYAQSFNYASWSMTVEFFFYFLFPFFTMWAYRQSTPRLITASLVLWGVSQIVHYFLWMWYFPAWELFIVYNPIFHLNSFILGVTGGIWYLREGQARTLKPLINYALLAGSVILVSAFIIAGGLFPQVPHDLQPMAGMLAPLFVVMILALAMDKTRLASFLNHPWLVLLGETAYASYILHVPIIWIYQRLIESSFPVNPQSILDATTFPLVLIVALIAHLYVDIPIRKWLRNVMKRVSLPLLVLDLAAVAASTYLSFTLRFGTGRGFLEFKSTAYLMFWLAFILRTVIAVAFNADNPASLHLPFAKMAQPVVISVTLGSLVITALIFGFYSLGWLPGFPRSVFATDWAVMLALSTLIRLGAKKLNLYPAI